MYKCLHNLLTTLLIAALCPQASAQNYGDLPASRFPPAGWNDVTQFNHASWVELDITEAGDVGSNAIPPNSSTTDAAAKIEAIVASLAQPAILYFPAGTYYLASDLEIAKSNVILKGDGQGLSVLRISAAPSANAEVRFSGTGLDDEITVLTPFPARGDDEVTVADASGIAVGDVVYIYDKGKGFTFDTYHYGQLAKVAAKAGSTLTLDMPLGIDFFNDPNLREVHAIRNVAVESLTIERATHASDAATNNLEFSFADTVYVHDVEVAWLERGGISAIFSIDVSIKRNRVHDAFSYGDGGQAYGIHLTQLTTRCSVADNKVFNLRHHIIVNRGANHCAIAFNSTEGLYKGTTGDLNVHGFSPHNNLWESNYGSMLKWDGRSEPNTGESSGLYITGYRNMLEDSVVVSTPAGPGNTPYEYPTLIGNIAQSAAIQTGFTDPFVGAQRIDGTISWGDADSGWTYPASLFRSTKPALLDGTPWPVFGPGAGSDFGSSNSLPATDRSRHPANVTIVDDLSADYADSGNWTAVTSSGGYDDGFKHDGNTGGSTNKWATFKPSNLIAGDYRIFVFWKATPQRASNATIRIYHTNGSSMNTNGLYDDYTVNMRQGNTVVGQFHPVGDVFTMSSSDYVGITTAGANGYVVSDAVRFVKQQ